MRPQVFIAHSPEDAQWQQRLTTMLAPSGLACWDSTQIQPGQQRQQETASAVEAAKVVVLLVSPALLASEFFDGPEPSAILATAQREQKLAILWIAVRPCLWQASALASYQAAHDAARPLSTMSDSEADRALVAICQQIRAALATLPASNKNHYRGLSAFQLEEAHLFFGREALTEKLWQRFKALYDQPDATRLLAILGPSGSGKSSVARAGLLADLSSRPVPGLQAVRRIVLKPGEHPLRALALALHPPPTDPVSPPALAHQSSFHPQYPTRPTASQLFQGQATGAESPIPLPASWSERGNEMGSPSLALTDRRSWAILRLEPMNNKLALCLT